MNKKLVQKVNKEIKQWTTHRKKLVVAIDGYTGVGKTTLLNKLAELNTDILEIHKDDFLLSREKTALLLAKTKDRSKIFELKNNDYNKLRKLINYFKKGKKLFKTKIFNGKTGKIDIEKTYNLSKKILVIEGVFLFHPKLNNLWDKRIYLDGNTKIIDERRVAREQKRWGEKYFPETHPDSHFKHTIIALKRYRKQYKPNKKADLVLKVI